MPKTFLGSFGRVDAVLFAGAVIGLALYLFAAPAVHPDRAVRPAEPGSVRDSALTFFQNATGVERPEQPAEPRVLRDPALLDSLLRRYGRTETARLVREDRLPGYYWEVNLGQLREPEGGDGDLQLGFGPDETRPDDATVRLTLDGRPFALSLEPSMVPADRLHAETVRMLAEDTLRHPMVDSVGGDRWTFRFDDRPDGSFGSGRRRRADGRGLNAPPAIRPFYLPPEGRVLLDRADASALARMHLREAMFGGDTAVVDSVTTTGEGVLTTATVYVSSPDSALGRRYTASVEIAPTGALVNLEPSFIQEDARSEVRAEGVLDVVEVAAFILLCILALVLFLRRIRHQLVDVGAALRDGAAASIAAAGAMIGGFATEVSASFSFEIVVVLVALSLLSLLGGVLVFFVSGAANSSARDHWSEKLLTLDLMRSTYVRNVPVGRSLIRGTLVGLLVAGVLCVGLIVLPPHSIALSEDLRIHASLFPGSSFFIAAMGKVYAALCLTYMLILIPASLVRAKFSSALVIVGIVTIVLAITQISPFDTRPAPVAFAVSAAVGVILAWTLWRFDVLALLVAFFTFSLLWEAMPWWVVPGVPERFDAVLSILLIGGCAAAGAVGVVSRRIGEDVPVVVPEYLEDLARKERLEREMELARSMQLSFLPRSLPAVKGLDLASVCLPAHEVGGDYYDFFRMGGRRLGLAVGDVSGKGMQAAFYMTFMKGILQSLVVDGVGPGVVLRRANELFRVNASRGTFMSMALGVVDLDSKTLTYARAGHNPLLLRKSGSSRLETVKPAGPALGLTAESSFNDAIEEISLRLDAGDLLVIYTDGVTEAMNRRRELYGDERLKRVLASARGDAGAVLQSIVDDVDAFRGGASSHDDMTLLVIRFSETISRPAAGS